MFMCIYNILSLSTVHKDMAAKNFLHDICVIKLTSISQSTVRTATSYSALPCLSMFKFNVCCVTYIFRKENSKQVVYIKA